MPLTGTPITTFEVLEANTQGRAACEVSVDSEETAKEIMELIELFLKDRGLELSEEKTLITHIDEGFDFLGWNFRKYNVKHLIKPSGKSIDSVTRKISDKIKGGKAWPKKNPIGALNPITTGWTNVINLP